MAGGREADRRDVAGQFLPDYPDSYGVSAGISE